jgi:hypothetical protein
MACVVTGSTHTTYSRWSELRNVGHHGCAAGSRLRSCNANRDAKSDVTPTGCMGRMRLGGSFKSSVFQQFVANFRDDHSISGRATLALNVAESEWRCPTLILQVAHTPKCDRLIASDCRASCTGFESSLAFAFILRLSSFRTFYKTKSHVDGATTPLGLGSLTSDASIEQEISLHA